MRPILEYGSTLFMGATPTYLSKLDRVQATMKRIGGFKPDHEAEPDCSQGGCSDCADVEAT